MKLTQSTIVAFGIVASLATSGFAGQAPPAGWERFEVTSVYINTRDRDIYNELEKNYQTKIEDGLKAPKPDVAGLLANAQAMLAKLAHH
jgi:hypothetical protein